MTVEELHHRDLTNPTEHCIIRRSNKFKVEFNWRVLTLSEHDELSRPLLVPGARTHHAAARATFRRCPAGMMQRSRRLGIHNPETRKFLTLLTKTGCSQSGFIGFFDGLYAAISPTSALL